MRCQEPLNSLFISTDYENGTKLNLNSDKKPLKLRGKLYANAQCNHPDN